MKTTRMPVLVLIACIVACIAVPTVIATTAQPSAKLTADVPGAKLFGVFGLPQVTKGQYLEVKVRVTNTGQVAFEPLIKITLLDPHSNRVMDKKSFDGFGTLNPGESKTYDIKTDYQVNTEGRWTCIVELYDKAHQDSYLDARTQDFEVVASHAVIDSVNITGYAGATAGIIAAALYVIRRHYGVA